MSLTRHLPRLSHRITAFAALLVFVLFGVRAHAQIAGEPLRVPVQFAARAWYPNPLDPGQDYGNVQINLAGRSAKTPTSTVPVNSPIRTVYLEPGKEYTGSYQMNYSRPWEGGFFAVPPGYAIYINGKKRTDLGVSGQINPTYKTFKIRVVNEARFDGPVGSATALAPGRILWEVSLGRKRSGEPAGNLLISYDGTEKRHWTEAGTPLGLNFETERVESETQNKIPVWKASDTDTGVFRQQIQAPQAVVDIVTINTTTYEIRFYHPSQVAIPVGQANPPTNRAPLTSTNESPFVVYEVQTGGTWADTGPPGSVDKPTLTVTKRTRAATTTGVDPTVVLTETTVLTRSTDTAGKFGWLAEGWWQAGEIGQPTPSQKGRPAVRISRAPTGLIEVTESGMFMDTETDPLKPAKIEFVPQAKETRTYADMGDPTAKTSTDPDANNWLWTAVTDVQSAANSDGTGNPLHSETLYYDNSDAVEVANRGFVYGIRDRVGGGWEYYDYVDKGDIFGLGRVVGIYRPYLNLTTPFPTASAAGATTRVGPALTSGTITSLSYSKDEDGVRSRVASRVTRVYESTSPAILERTDVTYAETTNPDILETFSKTYVAPGSADTVEAGKFIQTSRRDYKASVDNGLHTGRPHSETAADGSRICQVRQYVAWSSAVNPPDYVANSTGKFVRFATVRGWASAIPADSSAGTTASISISTYKGYDITDVHVVQGLSTVTEEIYDDVGDLIQTQTLVWKNTTATTGNWSPLTRTTHTYNRDHTLAETKTYDGNNLTTPLDTTRAVYANGRLFQSQEISGPPTNVLINVLAEYAYDPAGRVVSVTKPGYGGTPALRTVSFYDGLSRVVEERTGKPGTGDASSFASPVLRTARSFDMAGRLKDEIAPGGYKTTTTYDPAGRTTTVTGPTGATRSETTHLDGRIQRVQGTAVVPEFYDYKIKDARLETTVRSVESPTALAPGADNPQANDNTDRRVVRVTDGLGRPVKTSRPKPPTAAGAPNGLYDETQEYNSKGQLLYTRRPLLASTAYVYDAMGRGYRSGADINGNGILDLAGSDRISDRLAKMEFDTATSSWWSVEEVKTYETTGNATATSGGKIRKRLTGLTATLRAQEETIDAEGNSTTATTNYDFATRTTTREVKSPGLASPAIEVSINGFVTSRTSPDRLTTTLTYDDLGRPFVVVEPRVGATATYYKDGPTVELVAATTIPPAPAITLATATTLVDRVEERVQLVNGRPSATPGTRVSSTTYDTAGRVFSTTDADSKTTYQSFNDRGQLFRVWGEAAQPVEYGYNAFGDRTTLTTFKGGSRGYDSSTNGTGWNASVWPTGTGDVTTWVYDSASGVLLSKKDALDTAVSGFVSYQYDDIGRVSKRLWGRVVTSGPSTNQAVTTTYAYAPASGDLQSVTYNDGTPSLAYGYGRTGRTTTVTDLLGTRTFAYDGTKPWRLNSETLADGRMFTQYYETTTTPPAPVTPAEIAAAANATDETPSTVIGRNRGFSFGTTANPTSSHTQIYTTGALGRLNKIAYGTSATVVSQALTLTGGHTFTYSYRANSRLVSGYTIPAGLAVTRTYEDNRNILTGISAKWGTADAVAKYQYWTDDRGRRLHSFQTGSAFANYYWGTGQGLRHDYTYDARGQLTAATSHIDSEPTTLANGLASTRNNSAVLLGARNFAYGYDEAGNRTAATRTGASVATATSEYDAANQLTKRHPQPAVLEGLAPTSASLAVEDSYSVAPALTPTRAATTRYWHQQLEFLTAPEEWRKSGRRFYIGAKDGTASSVENRFVFFGRDEAHTYDADGNLTQDERWNYAWDAENRLIRQTARDWLAPAGAGPRLRLDFAYDYLGRRVGKRVVTLDATGEPVAFTETRFYYQGWNLVAEVAVNTDGTLATALTRSYTWGLDLVGSLTASGGVGALLAIHDYAQGRAFFPAYDGNGNIVSLVDSSNGAPVATYEYSPYGESLRTPAVGVAAANPFRFSTKYTDAETGLVYYGMRFYDPAKGRFINRDPIEERGGLNLYGFCGGDGVNQVDVLGMKSIWRRLMKWFGKNKWAGIVIAVALAAWGGWAISQAIGNSLLATAQAGTVITSTGGSFTAFGTTISGVATTASFGTAFAAPTLGGGFALTGLGSVVAGAAGGAAGGFIGGFVGTGLSGGNLGQSLRAGLAQAPISAVSGGLMAGIDVVRPDWLASQNLPAARQTSWLTSARIINQAERMALRSFTAGGLSQATGGDFVNAAKFSFFTDSAKFSTEAFMEWRWRSEVTAEIKGGRDSTDYLSNTEHTWNTASGGPLFKSRGESVYDASVANVGIPMGTGSAQTFVAKGFNFLAKEDGILQYPARHLPGFNNLSIFHDYWATWLERPGITGRLAGFITSQGTIPPAIYGNYWLLSSMSRVQYGMVNLNE